MDECKPLGVGGLPDADCDMRDSRARARVFYAVCTALMSVAIGAVVQEGAYTRPLLGST